MCQGVLLGTPLPESGGDEDGIGVYLTVGFHNFNLRIFNLRVSNPDKLIVDVLLTRCRISMCQGLGPNKHDEISEIDKEHRVVSQSFQQPTLHSFT